MTKSIKFFPVFPKLTLNLYFLLISYAFSKSYLRLVNNREKTEKFEVDMD